MSTGLIRGSVLEVEDVWAVCERAIAVAYQQDPQGLAANRDRLARMLFAPETIPAASSSCSPPPAPKSSGTTATSSITVQVQPPLDSSSTVLAIKDRLVKAELCSELGPLVEALLRDLEGVHITMDLLKATQIGRVVNGLRKHPSQSVAALAKRLVKAWKRLIDHALAASSAPSPDQTMIRAGTTPAAAEAAPPSEVKRSAHHDHVVLSCRNYEEKLESAKRKLKLGYELAESAKRQRTIHILHPHELPSSKKANLLQHKAGARKATAACSRFFKRKHFRSSNL